MNSSLPAPAVRLRSLFADDGEFAEILSDFLQTIPEKRATLQELHRHGSLGRLGVWAHQLKGASGGYGFPGLSTEAAELELACKAQDAERVAAAVDRLDETLSRVTA
jgi:histidine phosphotransfer protein HptB